MRSVARMLIPSVSGRRASLAVGGGLGSAAQHTGVDFAEFVIRDLERKVKYKQYYGARVQNAEIATL